MKKRGSVEVSCLMKEGVREQVVKLGSETISG